jgi:hypothetical protein
MGASVETRQRFATDLRDYTDTTAAIHLLKEALTGGPMVSLQVADKVVANENLKKEPKIGNVVKELLALAGTPGLAGSQWKKDPHDQKWHLEAAITIGGAVYTVEFIQEGVVKGEQAYTVKIESKLAAHDSPVPTRGKLFFDIGHKATVDLRVKPDGDLYAITKRGLEVSATSFSNYPYQTEILAKYADELSKGHDVQLAIAGTGSGKSILMAGLAQALQTLGPCVMIVPDALLVSQQTKEVQSMLGAGKVNGVSKKPTVFTLDVLKTSVDDPTDPEQVRAFFRTVLDGTSKTKFDQMVLQSTHPMFPVIASMLRNQMILIDEAHTQTFSRESIALLQEMQSHNSMLAFTATPTPELYQQFGGGPLTDLNLGEAIGIGTVRPIKPEVAFHDAKDLIDQAVIHYFDDYYLIAGMSGYADPVKIKEALMKADSSLSDEEAQSKAIDMAIEQNRVRCQRNMAFSDDKKTRDTIAGVYKKIAEGDAATIDKYKGAIATLRHDSEVDARLQMTLLFTKEKNVQKITELRQKIDRGTPAKPVDLVKDIQKEQQKSLQRTVNSFALALVLGDKPASIGEKDRTGKLKAHVEGYDKEILKYHPSDLYKTNKDIPDHLLAKFKACDNLTRKILHEKLLAIESTLGDLPPRQREAMIGLILDRAEDLTSCIRFSNTISSVIDAPITAKELKDLQVSGNYTATIDSSTSEQSKKEIIAMLDAGIVGHVVSDQTVATGVSLKDVLNVQIVNTYSPVVESDRNVINGTLSGPQAAGRCVRHTDSEARVQQYVDNRYKGTKMVLTVDEMIDPKNSAQKTKDVMMTRDAQAKKETKAATTFQTIRRANTTKGMFQEHKPRLKELAEQIPQIEAAIERQHHKLVDGKKYLLTTKQKLHNSEVELDRILDSSDKKKDKKGGVPPKYRNNPEVVHLWTQRKLLPRLVGQIEATNKHVETAMRHNQEQLKSLVEERDTLLEKIRTAPSQRRAANQ